MLGFSLAARAGDGEDPLARARELDVQVERLYGEGRYADAIPPARTQRGAGGRSFDAPRHWAAFVAYGR